MSRDEILIRFIVSPFNLTKSGKIKPAALSAAESIGLSTFREAHAADAELLATAGEVVKRARATDAKAGLFGVLLISASDLKRPRDEENGAVVFCVYDVPDQDVESHVDVFQRVSNVTDAQIAERRTWLFDRVKANFLSAGEFRAGLLVGLAPNK